MLLCHHDSLLRGAITLKFGIAPPTRTGFLVVADLLGAFTLKFGITRYSFIPLSYSRRHECFNTSIGSCRTHTPKLDPTTFPPDSAPKLQPNGRPSCTTSLEYAYQWRRAGIGTRKPGRIVRAYHCGNPIEGTVVKSKRVEIELEKESVLQGFVQRNLPGLFKLKLIKPEFRLGSQSSDGRRSSPRPDTLAFDEEKRCFVIIEYKKEDTNRIFMQLSTYASAPNNSNHKLEMINTYSKMQKENDSLVPLNADEICWNNYYCIYVSLDISDDLVENLRPIRKGSDIRMYEIHLFEGTTVLCRVDADDASKGDGLDEELIIEPQPGPKSPNLTSDPIPILNLNVLDHANSIPATLLFPSGEIDDEISSWRAAMRSVSHWLFDNNHIKDAASGRPLWSHIPRRPNGRPYSHEQLSDKLFVYLHYSNKDMLTHIQKLLKNINHKPYEFKIIFK